MDKLIVKYLQNKLTLQEQHQLSNWLDEDEQNPDILRKVEIYWKDHAINLEEKEERVKAKLGRRIAKEHIVAEAKVLQWPSNLLKTAAILVLGLTTLFAVYTLNDKQEESVIPGVTYIEKRSEPGEKVTIKLPDGSTVKLNSGSSLVYPNTFTGDKREVVLKGEGFFEVEKNPEMPFIVKVNKAMIKVLGTSFNINTLRSSKKVVVGVKTGQVKVSNQSENISRILNPDELVIFDNIDELMEFKKIKDPELIFGWTNQLLVFNDDHINGILNTLSNWYGVEFILNRNIDNKRVYTSKFENPTLKTVLESLAYVYDFKYEINEKTIIIK